MRIQSMVKKTIIINLIIVLTFSLSSCFLNPFTNFLEGSPKYDYLVFEFSETSYAWVDNCNIERYGEWIFGEKAIPIKFYSYSSESKIYLNSLESDLEPGKIYQDKSLAESFNSYYSSVMLRISIEEIDKANKIAFACAYIYEINEGILENGQKLEIYKMSSEEWREWMKDHSLDPDLYIPQ